MTRCLPENVSNVTDNKYFSKSPQNAQLNICGLNIR